MNADAATARRAVTAGAAFGLAGVAAGAFGAHALKARLEPEALAVFETAVRYQLVHAVVLLATGALAAQFPGRSLRLAVGFFTVGIVLFSGSLYALVLSGVHALGAITPLGGLLFLAGWLCLALGVRGTAAARAP